MSQSPFPGMDPYLEQAWHGVQSSLCTYASDYIQLQLGGGLLARINGRLVVEQAPVDSRFFYKDIQAEQRPLPRMQRPIIPASEIVLADPVTIEIEDEAATEGFIEIIDSRTGGRVVTVIEFLSITNKLPGPGREQYRRKRLELQQGGISLVEINLLRAGPFAGPFFEAVLDPENRTPYYAIVHRGWAGQSYQFYRMPLNERLPGIAIPLRETDPAVALDLQSLIDRVYRNGAYDQEIDYSKDPAPPLDGQSIQWADGLLKGAGVR